jgi:hypothetical protein
MVDKSYLEIEYVLQLLGSVETVTNVIKFRMV